MAEISFSRLDPIAAKSLILSQRSYSPAQEAMARECPHLIWVRPRSKYLPRKLRLEIFERDGPLCTYCDELLTESTFTIDHKLAVANGGNDDPENLTVACRPCNSAKGARWDG